MSKVLRGRLLPILLVTAVAALLAPEGFAAQIIYLAAQGATQGNIPGDSTAKGHEGSIEVYEVHHLILNEAGKKKHEPVVFTKRVDRASPPLYRALDTGEPLTLEFRYFRLASDGSGAEEHFYTIRLTGARLTAIEPVTRNVFEAQNQQLPNMERLRVVYQQMEITYQITGASVVLVNPAP